MIKSITEEMRNPQTLNLRQCEGLWVKMETYKLLLAQVDFLKSEYEESGINFTHTCSKGCKKPGCTRGFEEEIKALKRKIRMLKLAVAHSPMSSWKLRELQRKTTFKQINPDSKLNK